MKHIRKIIIPMLAALAITGCSQQTSKEEYIGTDAAKALAIQASGATEANAKFERTELDNKNGIAYYEVDFSADGYKYEYDIDAITGVVIESNLKALQNTMANAQTNTQTNASSPEQNQQGGGNSSTNAQNGTSSTVISEQDAQNAALAHAGLTSDSVKFVKTKLDWDDRRQVYEVEFYTADYKEYDYEIDASTGEIISYDYDAEGYNGNLQQGKEISADEAKNIALSQVPGATVDDIYEFETDYDDGRLEYEGKIYYSEMEYDFSIDGYSGAIRSWESESIYD